MPFRYKFSSITLRNGTVLELSDLTVLVGPNNSGKSRILKDIVALTCRDEGQSVIVESVEHPLPPTLREVAEAARLVGEPRQDGLVTVKGLKPMLEGVHEMQYQSAHWPDPVAGENVTKSIFKARYGAHLLAFVSTEKRLSLVSKGILEGASQSTVLQHLYHRDKTTELEIRRLVERAFPGTQVALDFTEAPRVEFRTGNDFSKLPDGPREARPILSACTRLDDQGDGLRSFVGVVSAIKSVDRPIMLIDEPEAFLHPPQAARIGELIGGSAGENKQIVVATHSVEVLRGLVSQSANVRVVRLERRETGSNIAVLNNEEIKALYNDPLLSSSGALSGIFYSGVIVTESDTDSRFYSALSTKRDAARDFHFVSADNKQTVPKLLVSYRKLGVRAAGVVDADVLNDAAEFGRQLDLAEVGVSERQAALEARARIETEIKAIPPEQRIQEMLAGVQQLQTEVGRMSGKSGDDLWNDLMSLRRTLTELRGKAAPWALVKKLGRKALTTTAPDFDRIYAILRAKGVFINPAGELEGSLADYGLPWRDDGRAWLRNAIPLLAGIPVEIEKQPWTLINDVHDFLSR